LEWVCLLARNKQGRTQNLAVVHAGGARNVRLRYLRATLPLSWYGNLPSPSRRRAEMAWKTPRIVEVPVGMEINMYACAARK
jgi:coenzyme PQQ precursor peptide PqqA